MIKQVGAEAIRIASGYCHPANIAEELRKLPAAEPEQTDCKYCHTDRNGYVVPIEKNGHAFVYYGMFGWNIELRAKGWHGEAKINFCPMCGRRLVKP